MRRRTSCHGSPSQARLDLSSSGNVTTASTVPWPLAVSCLMEAISITWASTAFAVAALKLGPSTPRGEKGDAMSPAEQLMLTLWVDQLGWLVLGIWKEAKVCRVLGQNRRSVLYSIKTPQPKGTIWDEFAGEGISAGVARQCWTQGSKAPHEGLLGGSNCATKLPSSR
jgi:hypothetical protein